MAGTGRNILELAKDQLLFAEGDPGQEMFIIVEGSCQVFLFREEFQVVLANLEKGYFFGEMSLLENEPRSANVVALESAKLLVINQTNFQQFISQNPFLTVKIMQGLSRRLRTGNEQVFHLKQELHRLKEHTSEQEKGGGGEQGQESKTLLPETGQEEEEQAQDLGQVTGDQPKAKKTEAAQQELPPQLVEIWKQKIAQVAGEQQLTCPVCQHRFTGFALKTKEIKLKRKDYWFREYYEGVEPLWFSLSCCPQCYYAAPQDMFDEVGQLESERLKEETQLRKNKVILDPPPVLNTKQVSKFYELALLSLGEKEEYLNRKAKIALELAWLYRGANKLQEERDVLGKAYRLLEKVIPKTANKIDLQRNYYLQALMMFRQENKALGEKLVQQALKVPGTEKTIVYVLSKKIEEKLANNVPLNL